jgi:hypothetical protein
VCVSTSRRVDEFSVLSSQLTNYFLSKITTGDEARCSEYDPESKRQSFQWKHPTSPRPKEARMWKSQVKTVLITFFDIKCIVHFEFIPHGQSVERVLWPGLK